MGLQTSFQLSGDKDSLGFYVCISIYRMGFSWKNMMGHQDVGIEDGMWRARMKLPVNGQVRGSCGCDENVLNL